MREVCHKTVVHPLTTGQDPPEYPFLLSDGALQSGLDSKRRDPRDTRGPSLRRLGAL